MMQAQKDGGSSNFSGGIILRRHRKFGLYQNNGNSLLVICKGARDISLSTKSLLSFLWANFNETYIKKNASLRTIQIYRSPEIILSL